MFRLTSRPNEVPSDAKFSLLIDPYTKAWRVDMIRRYFSSVDASAILSIPLSSRLPADRLVWVYNPSRKVIDDLICKHARRELKVVGIFSGIVLRLMRFGNLLVFLLLHMSNEARQGKARQQALAIVQKARLLLEEFHTALKIPQSETENEVTGFHLKHPGTSLTLMGLLLLTYMLLVLE
uniref:Uncharacterized protein n=1 Tax=Quercus lobata TaxID=97700 RepID=A0A7N2LQL7_QUELO